MLGKRLRDLRLKHNLTMKEFGQLFELAESTISGYENEIRKPDIGLLAAFAKYYETSTDYLLGRTNDRQPHHRDAYDFIRFIEDGIGQEFFNEFQTTSAEEKTFVLDVLRALLHLKRSRAPSR